MGKLQIRKAGKDDMEALIQLRYAFLEEFRHIGTATKKKLEPELRRYFGEHLDGRDFVALLGTVDGQEAVTAFLTINESPPNDQYPNGRIGVVFNVYTVPQHRHKGHAMRLMQELVDTAKQMGATAINLNASAAGRPLYEKLGFKVLSDTAMRMQMHD